MPNDPFKILNISSDSTLSEIKKAFRNLIMDFHPDLTGDEGSGQKASQVIEAYKSAEKLTVEREREAKRGFEQSYKERFGQGFKAPSTVEEFLFYWELLLGRADELFLSASSSGFYLTFTMLLLEAVQDKGLKSEERALLNAVFSSLLYICRSRSSDSRAGSDDEDYVADRVRGEIRDYFKAVLTASDYLSFRYNLNSPKEELLKSIYLRHRKVETKQLKEELFASLLLIFVASDERFTELWWASKVSEGRGLSRLLAE